MPEWVVRGAPKSISMMVNSGAESERQRRSEIILGFIGRFRKELASSIVDRNAMKEEGIESQHIVILDPPEAGFNLVDWANWTRFRVAGPFEDVGEDVELPED